MRHAAPSGLGEEGWFPGRAHELRAWCPSARPHCPRLASLCAQARTCKGQICTGSWDSRPGRCAPPAPHTEVCHAPVTVPVAVRSQRGGQKYTKGMKASGITWDNETMFNWLTTPKTFIKGTAPCQGGGRGAGLAQWPLRCLVPRAASLPAQARNAHLLSHLHLSGTQVRTWPSSASRSLRTVRT